MVRPFGELGTAAALCRLVAGAFVEAQEPLRVSGVPIRAVVHWLDRRDHHGAHSQQRRPHRGRAIARRLPKSDRHTHNQTHSGTARSHRHTAAHPNADRVPHPGTADTDPSSAPTQRRAGHRGEPVPQPAFALPHGSLFSERYRNTLARSERHDAGIDRNRTANDKRHAGSDRISLTVSGNGRASAGRPSSNTDRFASAGCFSGAHNAGAIRHAAAHPRGGQHRAVVSCPWWAPAAGVGRGVRTDRDAGDAV